MSRKDPVAAFLTRAGDAGIAPLRAAVELISAGKISDKTTDDLFGGIVNDAVTGGHDGGETRNR